MHSLAALGRRVLRSKDRKESCEEVQELMSAFIDSMASGEEGARVETHVAICSPCQRQLQAYISVKNVLLSVEERPVPADLVLETRVRLSHERNRSGVRLFSTKLDNLLRPLAIPAGVGVMVTLLFFVALLGDLKAPSALSASYDPPTRAYQRARADVPTVTLLAGSSLNLSEPLIIEALVDLRGRVVDYQVLSGSGGPELERWLKERMYYAEFRPARVFGEPVQSHVVLSFVGLTVI